MARQSESDAEYFANRTMKVSRVDGMTECWEWIGGLRGSGPTQAYGAACRGGKPVSAHRASYAAFRGPIPPGSLICHKCNNTLCCNPEHLYAGTYQDNADDMKAHGVHRARSPRRDGHGCAKLSEAQVAEIRELAKTKLTCAEIGARFGVTGNAVSRITSNQNWVDDSGPMNFRGRGEFNHMATLSKQQALEIQRLACAPDRTRTLKSIAAEYGTTLPTVVRIRQGVHWAVKGEDTMSGERTSP